MKEMVQKPGVRPWHGDELVALQGEPLESIQRFLRPFGSMVVEGCDYSGSGPYTVSAGYVAMEHADGYKIARYAGGSSDGVGLLYVNKTVTTKLYNDGNNHDALYDYEAVYVDSTDPSYAALDASLASNEKVYLYPIGNIKIDFDWAFKNKVMPGWASVSNPVLSPTEITSFSIQKRICIATGQVFVKGTITVNNSLPWLLAKWVPVVDLGIVSVFCPVGEQYFTGSIRYGSPGTFIFDDGNVDILTTFGLSIDTAGKLYLGARKSSSSSASYVVNFSGYYFFG